MKYGGWISLVLCLCILLGVRFYHQQKNLQVYQDGELVQFVGSLHQEPEVKSGTQRFKLEMDNNLQAYVVTRSVPEFHYGDALLIDGVFTKREFKGHDFWSIYFPKIQMIDKEENIVTKIALSIRNKAQKIYFTSLSPTSAALLLGMVFGGNHSMPDDFFEKLQTVGVLHVIAASGMNVAFVAGALLYMLGSFMKRQMALLFGVVGIIFYTFLTGFEPSIIRAAIMAILAFSASLLGKQYLGVLALFVAGYVMIWWQPNFLFDVGFQLSFFATLGILLIKPLFPFKKNALTEDFGTTLAAQVGTLPILLGIFGNVGIVSVLVNSLILWTVPFLMAFGSLAVALGFVSEPLGELVVLLCLPFLFFFEMMVNFFGGLGLSMHLDSFPWPLSIGYYLVLLGIVLFVHKKKTKNIDIDKEEDLILG